MKRNNVASWLFILVWVVSMVAALVPLLGGRPINVIFLGVAAVFLVLGVATRRNRESDHPSSDE